MLHRKWLRLPTGWLAAESPLGSDWALGLPLPSLGASGLAEHSPAQRGLWQGLQPGGSQLLWLSSGVSGPGPRAPHWGGAKLEGLRLWVQLAPACWASLPPGWGPWEDEDLFAALGANPGPRGPHPTQPKAQGPQSGWPGQSRQGLVLQAPHMAPAFPDAARSFLN